MFWLFLLGLGGFTAASHAADLATNPRHMPEEGCGGGGKGGSAKYEERDAIARNDARKKAERNRPRFMDQVHTSLGTDANARAKHYH
jgi:hypothetical protein